jgi:hypothetical protein
VRLDLRLPARKDGRRRLNVATADTPSNKLFGRDYAYKGVGVRTGRPAAEAVTEEEHLQRHHCACCMTPIADSTQLKAEHGKGRYFVCTKCVRTKTSFTASKEKVARVKRRRSDDGQ